MSSNTLKVTDTIRRQWLKDLGIPCVHIDPYYNHTAAWLGGKWLAPRTGSDSAMVLAIAHVWMTEGLYDKDYVANKTVGFEKWREHVLGNDDGVPKTPEWQENETGVPATRGGSFRGCAHSASAAWLNGCAPRYGGSPIPVESLDRAM